LSGNDAYLSGASDALQAFGIRTAADHLTRRMPDGPSHLGAEWLSKRLRQETEDYTRIPGSRASYRKLEKPSQWGNPTSLEASGSNAQNYSGMSPYGGV
jgi:hypothetical protein